MKRNQRPWSTVIPDRLAVHRRQTGTTSEAAAHPSAAAAFEHIDRYHRHAVAATFCGLLVLCAWQMYAYQRVESDNSDSVHYIVTAQSLAEGKGYIFNSKPDTKHPPGLPALLAVSSLVIGSGYVPFIMLMPVFGMLGLILSFTVVDREEHWTIAAMACLWLATSPHFFQSATRYVWSELPYLFVSMGALLLVLRLHAASSRPQTIVSAVPLSAAVVAAVMIRSVGVALVAALFATLIMFARSLRRGAIAGLAAAGITGTAAQLWWMAWTREHVVPDYPGDYMASYVSALLMKDPLTPALGHATVGDLAGRIGTFAITEMIRFSQLLVPIPWIERVWFSPFVLIPAVVLSAGIVQSFRRGRSVPHASYVLMYLGVHALWPFDEGTRFMLPLFPLLFLFACRGMSSIYQTALSQPAWFRFATPIAGTLAIAASISYLRLSNPDRQVQASLAFCWGVFALSPAIRAPFVRSALAFISRYAPASVALAFILVLGSSLVADTRIAAQNLNRGTRHPMHAGVIGAADWLLAHGGGSVVMAQQADILHRLTHQRTVSFPVTSDGRFITDVMRRHGVSYLVVAPDQDEYYTPSERDRLQALLSASPRCCTLIASGDRFEVYAVHVRQAVNETR